MAWKSPSRIRSVVKGSESDEIGGLFVCFGSFEFAVLLERRMRRGSDGVVAVRWSVQVATYSVIARPAFRRFGAMWYAMGAVCCLEKAKNSTMWDISRYEIAKTDYSVACLLWRAGCSAII